MTTNYSAELPPSWAELKTLLSSGAARTLPRKSKESLLKLVSQLGKTKTGFTPAQLDPVGFIRGEMGCTSITSQQAAIAASVMHHQATVVQSANGVGKTYIAAAIGLWFLQAFPFSKVITAAAPPQSNLENLLWGEVDKLLMRLPELKARGKISHLWVQPNAGDGHKAWHMTGVAIPSSGTPEIRMAKFSGKHAPYLLFILDEGDAIPAEVYAGIETCMTGGFARLLVLFNPRARGGPIQRLIENGARVIKLEAFDHPNIVTGKNVIEGAVTRSATVGRISRYSDAVADERFDTASPSLFQTPAFLDGEFYTDDTGRSYPPLVGGQWRKVNTPILYHMVLARYPAQGENQLINWEWIESARNRWDMYVKLHGRQPPAGVRPIIGLDVADKIGNDKNACCVRYGGFVMPIETWLGIDVVEVGKRGAARALETGAQKLNIDAIGVGAGAVAGARAELARVGKQGACHVARVMVSESPTSRSDLGEFRSQRDQLWWAAREWLRLDPTAMLPPSDELCEDLHAVEYDLKGKYLVVEDRNSIAKKLSRSPDWGSAFILTFYTGGDGWQTWVSQQLQRPKPGDAGTAESSE